jgi:3-dehydroquinate dehydratase-1
LEKRLKRESSKDNFRIVASLLGDGALSDAKRAEECGADILELRIDTMSDETVRKIRDSTELPILITFRRKEDGGFYEGDEENRKERLLSLLPLADMLDIELNSEIRDEIVEKCKEKGIECIVSYHDIYQTPSDEFMERVLRESLKIGDIAKLAVRPTEHEDVLRVLRLLLKFRGDPICVISMGEIGKYSRVVAPLYGSVLTYGCISRSAAEGQLHIEALRNAIELLRLR